MWAYMPTTDYTEFLHNVKQEYITNSYELYASEISEIVEVLWCISNSIQGL